ncbi:MAG: formyltetrahydrofolate deformylase [Elusimicrobiota bacterium]
MSNYPNAILLISCPDKRGLIARITDFIFKNNGNIEHSDQHVDLARSVFFMRIEWSLEEFKINKQDIGKEFKTIADKYNMKWNLYFTDSMPRMGIFVSEKLHCLYDLLYRYKEKEFNARVPLIISNHSRAGEIAESFGIDFHEFPINSENKISQEEKEIELLKEYNVDFIVLARYMQIFTKQFVDEYPQKIINIHHSFLPAFAGAKPYEQAYARGVKIVGATSHYVTEELDAGPIIEQDVVRISHRDSIDDIRKKGEDLEKVVLSRAVNWHLKRKVLVYSTDRGKRTVIFD